MKVEIRRECRAWCRHVHTTNLQALTQCGTLLPLFGSSPHCGVSLCSMLHDSCCDCIQTSSVDSKHCNTVSFIGRGQLKCDGTRAETRFRLSAKRTSPFKSPGASVQSTTGSRGVRISGRNAGYTMFRGSVKGTGYTLHSPVSPSLPLPCVTVCHHISTGV
jgi:hypothetical protein